MSRHLPSARSLNFRLVSQENKLREELASYADKYKHFQARSSEISANGDDDY
jgi:hypothetical protein